LLAGGRSGGCRLVVVRWPDLVFGAAGLLAAEGGDGVGAVDGPVHAGLLEPLADDGFAAGFHDAGADKQAALAEPVVAHAGRVVLEVAERRLELVDAYRFRRHLYYATSAITLSIPSSNSDGDRYPSAFCIRLRL